MTCKEGQSDVVELIWKIQDFLVESGANEDAKHPSTFT